MSIFEFEGKAYPPGDLTLLCEPEVIPDGGYVQPWLNPNGGESGVRHIERRRLVVRAVTKDRSIIEPSDSQTAEKLLLSIDPGRVIPDYSEVLGDPRSNWPH